MSVLFFDGASQHPGAVDRNHAQQIAKTLIDTLRAIKKVNQKIALNTAHPIKQCQLAEGWTLQAILGGAGYKEEWEFIRHLNDRVPFSASLEEKMQLKIDSMECQSCPGGVLSAALAWAIVQNSATVSFDAHADWSRAWVAASYCTLDDLGNLHEQTTCVRNFSQPTHVQEHIEWLSALGLGNMPTAAQAWIERAIRFPGLRFLSRVEDDLTLLSSSGAPFFQALKTLSALSKDVTTWNENSAWPLFSQRASPESEGRQNLCWAYDERTGTRECFEWHVRFTGNFPGRIHFRVDEKDRSIIIAYVGRKLTQNIAN